MHNSIFKNLRIACLQVALSASLSVFGGTSSYYRTRRGGYTGNKQYLADPGLTPFSSINFPDVYKAAGSVGGKDAEVDVDFHFEKGQKIKELLIVDGAVQNKSVFLSQARPGVDVVEIESGKSGIVQLLATLTKYRNLEAVHVISHAKSGSLQLGNDVIDAKTFEENVTALAALNGAIKSGGDLLFYGCELAKGAEGERFLEVVKGNYDFDIAASNDLTGNDAAKADWDLEIQTGDIEATPLPESIALKDFTGELQFSGTINFQEIKTAGDYTSFGGTKSDTEFYTSASNEYTLYTSGSYYGTGTFANALYTGDYGGTVTMNFDGGATFNATSIYLKRFNSGSANFNISSNLGAIVTNYSVSNSGTTVTLSSNNVGITHLYVSYAAGDVGGGAFYIDDLVVASVSAGDMTPPSISSSSLDGGNGFIDVTFSEGVFNTNGGSGALQTSDFDLSLTGGTATSPTVTSVTQTGGGGLAGGETTIRVNFSVTGTPDGGETLEVDITDATSIFDAAGNAAVANQTANNTATLNDEAVPVISSVSLDGGNGFIDVTFSEGVFNTNGGSGALQTSDFDLSLTGGTATSPTVTSVTQTGGGGLAGGETTIRVNFSVTGTPDGGETLEVDITDATSIFDAAGNAAVANQTANNTATLNDEAVPVISSVSLDGGNGFIDVTFSEGVFNTNGGSGALQTSDFDLSLTGGTATSPTVTSVTQTGGGGLAGGETTIRVNFSVTGTPDGGETLEVDITDATSIFDAAGNAAVANQTANNTATLNDEAVPVISSVSLDGSNGFIDVTFSEGVFNTNGGSGALQTSDFDLSLTGGTATSPTVTSVTQTGGGGLAGGETTIRVNFSVTGTPDGGETLEVDITDATSIFDAAGNAAVANQTANNTATLNAVDVTAPEISSVSLDGSNSYIDVTFSEGVFNTNGGSGALETSDFDLSITGGSATSPTVTSVTQTGGGGLAGGETTIRVNFSTTGDADGTETLEVDITDATSIFDAAGNAAVANQTANNTATLNDLLIPEIGSVSLDGSNGFIDVTFSEGVFDTNGGSGALETSDFDLSLTGGTATSPTVTSVTQTGGGGLAGGETAIRVNFSVTGTPDGGETLEVDITDATSIFDANGNAAAANQTANNTATLNDEAVPVISSVSLDGSNGFIDVTFSEGVFNTNGGSGALQTSDFDLSLTGGTATSPTVTSVTQTGGGGLAGGETTIRVNFSVTGTPDGGETLEVDITDATSIFDAAGNAAVANQTANNTATLNDQAVPVISSVSLAGDNSFIDVTFTEGVFNSGAGSGALESSDFDLSITGGNATSPTVTSVTQTGGGGLAGGETTIRVNFSTTGDADGTETLEVDITDATSIFDAAGNAAVANQTANNTATLNDLLIPVISSVSLDGGNGFIDVTFSEGVFNTNGGSGALQTSDFDLSLTGGTATSPTVTSVTQTGGGGLAGGETTIRVNFSVTGTPDGGETLEVDITDATSIFDAAGNAAAANQTANNTATLNDEVIPVISSVSLDGSNGFIDVTFSEGVFNTNGGSGALQTSDFDLSLTGGTAASPTVTSVTQTGGGGLAGGETTIRVNFSVTGTPDGAETLEVDITDATSIFDAAGNAAVANQTANNTATLNDQAPPTVAITRNSPSVENTTASSVTFDVVFSEVVANVDATDFTVSGGVSGASVGTPSTGDNTNFTVTISSYTGTGTLNLDFVGGQNITDVVGNNFGGAASPDETYTIVTPDANSDIIAQSGYSFQSSIDPSANTNGGGAITAVADGVQIAGFTIRDGGSTSPDTDDVGTTLTDLTLNFSNHANLERVALFDGTTLLDEDAAGATVSFTGLSIVAADDGTKDFDVYVTFVDDGSVSDNDVIDVTINNADVTAAASGSDFDTFTAASMSPTGAQNQVIVGTSALVITTEPTESAIATTFTIIATAQDSDGNTDTDFAEDADITIHSSPMSGAFDAGTTSNVSPSSGVFTFSGLSVNNGGDYEFDIDTDGSDNGVTIANFTYSTPLTDRTGVISISDASSDIIENAAFDYPEYVEYLSYQDGDGDIDEDATEVVLVRFDIRDGGETGDSDSRVTRMQNFQVTVTSGADNLDRVALYTVTATDGGDIPAGVELGEFDVSDESNVLLFDLDKDAIDTYTTANGVRYDENFDVTDDGSVTVELRASFNSLPADIGDQEQITFTITSVTTDNGGGRSGFALTDGTPVSGTSSGITPANSVKETGDNLVEVVGDRVIVTNDAAVLSGSPYERDDDNIGITIEAQDVNGNMDLDEGSDLAITGPSDFDGAGATTEVVTLVSGTVTTSFTVFSEEASVVLAIADNDANTGSRTSGTSLSTGASTSAVDITDTTAPTIANTATDLSPFDTETGVALGNTLTMTFDEDVAVGSGNISVVLDDTPPEVITLDVTDNAEVSVTDDVVTLTLPSLLKGSASYYVLVDAGAFNDSPNNTNAVGAAELDFAGFATDTDWTFATQADTDPPTVTVTRETPSTGTVDATKNSVQFNLEFSEEMNDATVLLSEITVSVSGTVTIDGDGTASQTANNYATPVFNNLGDDQNYTLTLNNILGDGDIQITVGTGVTDAAGNNMASAVGPSAAFGIDNSPSTFDALTIASDYSDPTLANSGNVVTLTMDFDEDQGANPTVTFRSGGDVVNGSVTVTETDGVNFIWTATYTVNALDTDGAVTFDVNFTDVATNAGAEDETDITNASSVTIDRTSPTIIFARNTPGAGTVDETNSNSVSFDVAFNEAIDNSSLTLDDIQIDIAGGATVAGFSSATGATAINAGTAGTVVLTPDGDDQNYTILINNVAGDGTIGLTLSGTGIIDPSGNQLASGVDQSNTSDFGIDNIQPTVVVTDDHEDPDDNTDDTIRDADNLTITATFTEANTLTGTPQIAIGTSVSTTNMSSTADPLIWTYSWNVPAGDDASEIVTITATDEASNTIGTQTNTNAGDYEIDNTAPTASNVTITSTNASVTFAALGDDVDLDFTVSEDIDSNPVVGFNSGGGNINGAIGISNSVLDYTASYTVNALDNVGAVTFTIDFTDVAGNVATQVTAVSGTGAASSVTVDSNAPSITGITLNTLTNGSSSGTNDNSVVFTIVFSEPVGNFTYADDIQPSLVTTGSLDISGSTPVLATGDNITWTLTFGSVANDGNLSFDVLNGNGGGTPVTSQITDGSGNTLQGASDVEASSPTVTFDNSAPGVTLTRNTPSSGAVGGTNADNISFDVAFDEVINDGAFALSDIQVNIPDGATINGFGTDAQTADNAGFGANIAITNDGDNQNYTITVATVAGDGDLGITLLGAGIEDNAGNFLGGGAGVNQTSADFGIDNTLPTATAVTMVSNNATSTGAAIAGNTITLSLTVDDALTGTPNINFIRSGGALINNTAAIGGSNPNYTISYIVNALDADGTVTFDIDFTDDAGNAVASSVTAVTSGAAVVVDNIDPGVTLTANAPGAGSVSQTNSNSLAFDVAFDETIDNTGFTLADITVNIPDGASVNGITTDGLTADNAGFGGQISITPDGDNQNYTINFASVAGDGTLGITLSGTGITDPSGNQLNGGTNETSSNFTVDNTDPAVTTLTRAATTNGSADNTNDDAVTFNLVFSEPVDGASFTLADIQVNIPDGASINGFTTDAQTADNAGFGGSIALNTVDNETYTVVISNVAGDGNLGVTLISAGIPDPATNQVAGGTNQVSPNFVIDNTAPTATAVTMASNNGISSGAAIAGDVITISVTVDDALAVDPNLNFIRSGGALINNAAVVGGSNPNYTISYTVNAADQDGSVTFDFDFTDDAGNAVAASVTGLTSGSAVVVDNIQPGVTLTTNAPGAGTIGQTNSDNLAFDVAFDETIDNAGFTLADITVNIPDGASVNGVTTDGLTADNAGFGGQISITPDGDNQNYTINFASVAGDGDLGITLSGTGITDPSGNQLNGGTNETSSDFTVDNSNPTATTFTRVATTNGSSDNTNDDAVTFDLVFSEPLEGASFTLADIQVNIPDGATINGFGTDAQTADNAGFGGSIALNTADNETYTIVISNVAGDGNLGLTLLSAGIPDPATNQVAGGTNQVSPNFVIDNTAPTATAVTMASNNSTSSSAAIAGDVITISVTVDDALAADPNVNFIRSGGALINNTATVGGTNPNYTVTYTVNAVDQDGTVTFDFDFTDDAGNAVAAPVTAVTSGVAVVVDRAEPSVTIATNTPGAGLVSQTNSNSLSFDVAFDETIDNSGFTLADITVNIPDGASVNGVTTDGLTADNAGFGSQISITPDGDNQNYTINFATVAGDGTLGITLSGTGITDPSGNQLNGGTNETSSNFTVDNTDPTVNTLTRAATTNGSADNTNDDAVTFNLVFSEPVDGASFTLADIQVNIPDGASINGFTTDAQTADNAGFGGSIALNTADNETYTIVISNVAGDGNLGVTLLSTGIPDPATNQVAGGTNQVSPNFVIDNTAPTATTVTMASNNGISSGAAIAGDVITISVTVDDALDADPSVNFIRSGGSLITNASVVGGTNPNYTITYTINGSDQDGTVTFDFDFTDDAGNAVAASVTGLTFGSAVVVDNIQPGVTLTTNAPGAGTVGQTNSDNLSFDVVFDEAIDDSNFDLDDITINLSGTSSINAITTDGLTADNAGFGSQISIDRSAADNINYTINIASVAGDGDLGITLAGTGITDQSGNQLNGGTNETSSNFTVDNTNPTASTFTRAATTNGSADNTNDDAVTFNLVFSEPLEGSSFTLDDIQVNIPDGATINGFGTDAQTADNAGFGGSIALNTADNQTYTIVISNVAGDGNLGLTLLSSGIPDPATNQVAGGTNQVSPNFVIDNTAPTATAVTMASNNSTNTDRAIAGDVVTISVTVDDALAADPNVNFIRSGGALINNSEAVGGTNPNYTITYTVNALDANGTVTFDFDFTDDAGNAVASSVTAVTSGTTVEIDHIAPSIESLEIISNNATDTQHGITGNTVTIEVEFDDDLNGTPTFTNVQSGGVAIADGSPGLTETDAANDVWQYTYVVNAGDTDGAVTFDLNFNDDAGNAGTAASESNITNSSSMEIDNTTPTAPTVSIATNNGTDNLHAVGGNTVTITLDFNEDMSAVSLDALQSGGATVTDVASAVFTETDAANDIWQATYTADDPNDTEGNVTFSISFDDDAGNAEGAAVTQANLAGNSVEVDFTAPTIEALTIASGTAPTDHGTATEVITLTMDFDDDLTSAPNVVFLSGLIAINDVTITYMETDAANDIWTAAYTVDASDANGNVTFTLNFTDDAGNAGTALDESDLTSGTTVEIDHVAPTIERLEIISNNVTDTQHGITGNTVTIEVEFDDDLNGTPTFTNVQSGGVAIADGSPGLTETDAVNDVWQYTYVVNAGDTDGAVTFDLNFNDDAGNAGTAASESDITNSSSIEIDNTTPTAPTVSIATNNGTDNLHAVGGNTVTITLDFNEDMSAVSLDALQSGGATVTDIASATFTEIDAANDIWQATYTADDPNDSEGNVTFSISFDDDAGNAEGAAITQSDLAGNTVEVDFTAPTLEALSIASGTAPTDHAATGEVVTLTMDFDDDISSDPTVVFTSGSVAVNGTVTYTETDVANDIWTAAYTVNASDFDGSVDFNLSFTDDAGNTTSGIDNTSLDGGGTSQTVEIDKTNPVIESLSIARTSATDNTTGNDDFVQGGDQVTITVDFNDDIFTGFPTISNLQSGAVSMVASGSEVITETNAANDEWTFVFTVDAGDTDGNITFEIDFNDDANNMGTQATQADITDGSSVTVDNTAPVATISAVIDGTSTTEIIVSFNEDVATNGTNPTDFTVVDEDSNNYAVSAQADDTAEDGEILLTVADFSAAEGDLLVTYANNNGEIFDLANNAAPTTSSATIERTFTGQVSLAEIATGVGGDTDADVALYRTTTDGVDIFAGTPVTFTPSVEGSTITIYRDEALTDPVTGAQQTGVTKASGWTPAINLFLADEGLTLGGTSSSDYDADGNDINGVYTFYITETAVNETDSEGSSVIYSLAFLDNIDNTNDRINFSVGESATTDLRVGNSLSQELQISGVAIGDPETNSMDSGGDLLTSFVNGEVTSITSATFNASIVGQGTYNLDFQWTNDDNISARFEDVVTLSITPVVAPFFESAQKINFTRTESTQDLLVNSDPTGVDVASDTDGGDADFYDLEIYYVQNETIVTSIGVAGVNSSAGGEISDAIIYDGTTQTFGSPSGASSTDWDIDPSAIDAFLDANVTSGRSEIDTLIIAYITANDNATSSADLTVNTTTNLYLYEPVDDIVTQEAGFSTEYFTCEGDIITAIATSNAAESATYIWYADDGDLTFDDGDSEITRSTTLTNANILNQTTTFTEIDGSGQTTQTYTNDAGVNGTTGIYYFWVHHVRGATEDFLGTTSSETLIAITVFEDTAEPIFDSNTAVTANNSDAVDFTLFYDASELTESVTFTGSSSYNGADFNPVASTSDISSADTIINEFRWYTSNEDGTRGTQITSGSTVTAQQLQLTGLTSDADRYIYLEEVTNIVSSADGTTLYDGCTSNGVVILFSVKVEPSAPTGTTSFFYCEGETVANLTMNGESGNSFRWLDVNNNLLHTETADGDGVSVADVADELGIGSTPEDSIYTIRVYQVSDIVSATTNSSSIAPDSVNIPFNGAISDTTTITINVKAVPAAPVLDSPDNGRNYCDDTSVQLSIAFTDDGNADLFRIYQGDGETREDDLSATQSAILFDLSGDDFLAGMDSTIFISQVSFSGEGGAEFAGCESALTEVNVFPNPSFEVFDNNSEIFVPEACEVGITAELAVNNLNSLTEDDFNVDWTISGLLRDESNNFTIEVDSTFSGITSFVVEVENTTTGCVSTISENRSIGDTPIADFRITNITENNGTSIQVLDNNGLTSEVIRTIAITVVDDNQNTVYNEERSGGDGSDLIESFFVNDFDAGAYTITMVTTSTSGCVDDEGQSFSILPQVTITGDTTITFDEGNLESWFAEEDRAASGEVIQSVRQLSGVSWENTSPGGAKISDDATGGTSIMWVTNSAGEYNQSEVSYVYSPSFDISGVTQPTVSFDYYSDMTTGDGVVLQLSIDDGRQWRTLGQIETGLNWYLTEGIAATPGGINTNPRQLGWDAIDSDWLRGTHAIDGQDFESVRFRFALGSRGDEKDAAEGFAFDNFRIFSRDRITLFETFTSTQNLVSGTNDAITLTETIRSRFSQDVIPVNYFTNLADGNTADNTDVIYAQNPSDPNARLAYYGVNTIPTGILGGDIGDGSGEGSSEGLGTYGFTEADIFRELLEDTQFNIGLNVVTAPDEENSIDISLNVVAQIDQATSTFDDNSQISTRVMILQETVLGENVENADNEVVFNNVLRDILPLDGEVVSGNIENGQVVFDGTTQWDVSGIFADPNQQSTVNLIVVAFVQDEINRTVYQVRSQTIEVNVPETVTSTIPEFFSSKETYEIYPNPAQSVFTVELEKPTMMDLNWVLVDQTGKKVAVGDILRGNQTVEVITDNLSSGLYFFQLYNNDHVWDSQRVMIMKGSR